MDTKETTKQIALRIPESLWRQLSIYAKEHHRSLHGLVLDLAQEALLQRTGTESIHAQQD